MGLVGFDVFFLFDSYKSIIIIIIIIIIKRWWINSATVNLTLSPCAIKKKCKRGNGTK